MQRVVSDRPYRFVAPSRGAWWPRALHGLLPWRLRRVYGIESMEQTGAEKVAASLRAGCGVLLAPVHPVQRQAVKMYVAVGG